MLERWSSAIVAAAAVAAFSSHPTSASAQAHTTNWTPWLGCWEADGAPDGEYLCIVPDGAGIRMLTVADGAVRADARVITDGRARDIRQDGCSGSERAHWSKDGRRVFLGSSLTCDGGLTRKASGIFAFAAPDEWLSVQTVTIDDRVASRSVRYYAIQPNDLPADVAAQVRGSNTAASSARQLVAAAISEADIDEAASSVDPTAVQEWLDATRQPYHIGDDVQSAVVSASALDLTAGSNFQTLPASPTNVRVVERVVERQVHVHEHVHVVRHCWDPFVAGYVDVFGGWGWGVTYGTPGCGRTYYSRYSPWGYDLYGWRVVHRPIVIVRGAPIIVRVRDRDYWRNRDYWRDRDWNRDRGSAQPRNPGGRITRDGYRSSDRPSERATQPGRVVRSVNDNNTPRATRPSDRNNNAGVARPSDRSGDPRSARLADRSNNSRGTPPSERPSDSRTARPSERSSDSRVSSPSERNGEARAARPADRSSDSRAVRPADRRSESRAARPADRSSESRAASPSTRSSTPRVTQPTQSAPSRVRANSSSPSKESPSTRSARARTDSQ